MTTTLAAFGRCPKRDRVAVPGSTTTRFVIQRAAVVGKTSLPNRFAVAFDLLLWQEARKFGSALWAGALRHTAALLAHVNLAVELPLLLALDAVSLARVALSHLILPNS